MNKLLQTIMQLYNFININFKLFFLRIKTNISGKKKIQRKKITNLIIVSYLNLEFPEYIFNLNFNKNKLTSSDIPDKYKNYDNDILVMYEDFDGTTKMTQTKYKNGLIFPCFSLFSMIKKQKQKQKKKRKKSTKFNIIMKI